MASGHNLCGAADIERDLWQFAFHEPGRESVEVRRIDAVPVHVVWVMGGAFYEHAHEGFARRQRNVSVLMFDLG
jgi:hypothetical protein